MAIVWSFEVQLHLPLTSLPSSNHRRPRPHTGVKKGLTDSGQSVVKLHPSKDICHLRGEIAVYLPWDNSGLTLRLIWTLHLDISINLGFLSSVHL